MHMYTCTYMYMHRYCTALKRALQGHAKRKYFEHTGGLLTADGTDDDLIKLEGGPKGHKFTWIDDDGPVAAGAMRAALPDEALTPEPEDVSPTPVDPMATALGEDEGENILDDEDDEDEEDVPPEPCLAPEGFEIVDAPPAEQLAFSKGASAADNLVGSLILFNWPVVGWCVGTIKERNTDGRVYKKVGEERVKVNFIIYYEIDDQEIKTVLRAEEYGGDDYMSWVLLAAADEGE